MKVLVTGANGFLANNIIRELNKRQIPVRGLVRKTSNLLSLAGASFEKAVVDVNDIQDFEKAVYGCDVIIHAAANTSQSALAQLKTKDHIGTNNVIDFAEKNDLKKVIFISSANTFGFGNREFPGVEDNEMDKLFMKSKYAVNKLSSQNLILKAVKDGRINATVVNPSFMIGPYDARPSSGKILLMYLNNKFALCPRGGKSFVPVSDVTVATCNAIEKGKNGACYLLTGENLTYQEFFQKIEKVTEVSKPTIRLNKCLLRKIGRVGSLINTLGGNMELDLINAELLNSQKFYSASKAIAELEMPQTPVENAIGGAFRWFLENDYLKFQRS